MNITLKQIKSGLIAIICAATIVPTMTYAYSNSSSAIVSYATSVVNKEQIGNKVYNVKSLASYPIYKQTGRHDCWQYTIRSITKYKFNYVPTTNEFFYLGNQYYSNTGYQPYNLINNADPNVLDVSLTEDAHKFFLQNYFGSSVSLLSRRLTYSEIINKINNDSPITMLMSKTNGNGGGHAMVLVGYAYNNNASTDMAYLKCMDPATGKCEYIPTTGANANSDVIYNRVDGNVYRWAKTIVI